GMLSPLPCCDIHELPGRTMQDYLVKTSIDINTPIEQVWDALTNPSIIKEYLYGTEVISNWQKDSPIVFKGEWQGKHYEDKGIIQRIQPYAVLEYTHWSNLSGKPNTPENQNTVSFILTQTNGGTHVALTQTNN